MTISLISAMAHDRVIGIKNRLPWKLPADMKWFREQTMGKPIVMGRKTFESFGAKPLPGRTNIIITRDIAYKADNCLVVHSIDDALKVATPVDNSAASSDVNLSTDSKTNEIMIIGGASFYQQMLPLTHRMYLTEIHETFQGDSWFPEYNQADWHEIKRIDCTADEKNRYDYSFVIYERNEP